MGQHAALLRPFVGLFVVASIILLYQLYAGKSGTSPFFTGPRLQLIAKQSATVGLGALGMTVIIISGGIDLAAGSIVALASVALAMGLRDGWSPIAAILLVLAICGVAGMVNGILITGLRLAPFIVTLGTMSALRGLAEQVAHQQKISVGDAPAWFAALLAPPHNAWQLMAAGVWIVVLFAAALAAVMRYTVFGRHVFAIGSNEATARLCGVNVARTKIIVYALGGLFFALAGILSFSDLGNQGDPGAGLGMELQMIAAVVIGGGSLNGGRGSVLGSLVGALTMTAISSGCTYAQVSDPLQKIIIGAIIIGAVAIDRLAQPGRS